MYEGWVFGVVGTSQTSGTGKDLQSPTSIFKVRRLVNHKDHGSGRTPTDLSGESQ